MLDIQEFLRNFFKYLIEGVGVAVAASLISGRLFAYQEAGLIGLSAAVTLMILDMYAPGVAAGARQGTGYGLGMQLTNLPQSVVGVEGFEGNQEGGLVDVGRSTLQPEALKVLDIQGEDDMSGHYRKNCSCQQPCELSCQSNEGQCDLECSESAPCHIDGNSSLAAANCSYKLIDGYYSKQVLPGYNECVKAYNA